MTDGAIFDLQIAATMLGNGIYRVADDKNPRRLARLISVELSGIEPLAS